MGTIITILFYILALLFCLAVLALIVLIINSRGRLSPLKGASPIAEKVSLQLGGPPQKIFIYGQDQNLPVLLFLHGGPGSPEMPGLLIEPLGTELTKRFILCHWDQRGCGMSYSAKENRDAITKEMMVKDTIEITKYLCKRFNKSKIFLAGHSWGTVLGVDAVRMHPELYSAYIGIGQCTDQQKSEELALDYFIQQAIAEGDKQSEALYLEYKQKFPEIVSDKEYLLKVRNPALIKYKVGLARNNPEMQAKKLMLGYLMFNGYTIKEKVGLITAFYKPMLIEQAIDSRPFEQGTKFEVPFFIIQGRYDYQVSTILAEQYMEMISAPIHKLYIFEDAAHCPNFEQPLELIAALDDIQSLIA